MKELKEIVIDIDYRNANVFDINPNDLKEERNGFKRIGENLFVRNGKSYLIAKVNKKYLEKA